MNSKKIILSIFGVTMMYMCVPPADSSTQTAADKEKIDSLRKVRCPRLMSSAAEYYRNRDWKQTAKIYKEITSLNCDEWNPIYAPPQEIYQYYAIAYEQMGKFDSSEYVLLDGLQKLPNNVELRKRLAYSFKKQGKLDQEIVEYERLIEMAPQEISIMNDLSKLYKDNNRFDDQIFILEKILQIDGNNEIAQSELAMAFENSGRDPLDVYRKRYEANKDNISYGLGYSGKLIEAERHKDAIPILKEVINQDPSSKIAYRKLGEVYKTIDNLKSAASAYEDLFNIDSRDARVALEISKIYLDDRDYRLALKWADKASSLDNSSGDGFFQKAEVYFQSWENFQQNNSLDDRIVAKLAYNYYSKAERKGYRGETNIKYLNELDSGFIFGKEDWFMVSSKIKRSGSISTSTAVYDWVKEPLKAENNWK